MMMPVELSQKIRTEIQMIEDVELPQKPNTNEDDEDDDDDDDELPQKQIRK